MRGDRAVDADLLRAAGLELGRSQIGAVARREADRRVRRLPLRRRALGFLYWNDPHALPRSVRGRAGPALEGTGSSRANLRAHRISDRGGEAHTRSRELQRHRDLSRFVLGLERDRREGTAAAAPRERGGTPTRPGGKGRDPLRPPRHLFPHKHPDSPRLSPKKKPRTPTPPPPRRS